MHKTQFAGLTAPDSNDSPLQVDGGSFATRNPDLTDHFLQIGAVTHRHDAHAPLDDPTVAASAAIDTTTGSIPSGSDIYIGYTLIDEYGGETRISPVVNATTPPELAAPAIAFDAEFDSSAGVLPVGSYYYAITMLDAGGGETMIGPSVLVTRPPGTTNGQVNFTGLAVELGPDGGVLWRLWRADNGGQFNLIASGADDTFTDPGINPVDHAATPPTSSRATHSTNTLTVTMPDATAEPLLTGPMASAFALYVSDDGAFSNPCLYDIYPVASAGASIVISDLTVQTGAPPDVSRSIPGASKIFAPTDIEWGPDGPPSGGGGGGIAPSPADYTAALETNTGWSGPYLNDPPGYSRIEFSDGALNDVIYQEMEIAEGMLPGKFRPEAGVGIVQAITGDGQWHEAAFENRSGPLMTEGTVTVKVQFPTDPSGIDIYAIAAKIPHGPMLYVDAYIASLDGLYLSPGVYDPTNNTYDDFLDMTGNSAPDLSANPLSIDTPYWLQIRRTGTTVVCGFYDVDPVANPDAVPLADITGTLRPAQVGTLAYAGYSGFGWGESDAADGLIEFRELVTHATAGGIPPSPLPTPPDVSHLGAGEEIRWVSGSDVLGRLRVDPARSGPIQDQDVLTFADSDASRIGNINNFEIVAGYGHDQAYFGAGQISTFDWSDGPAGTEFTPGDFEFVTKINRPDVGATPVGEAQMRFELAYGGMLQFIELPTGESEQVGAASTTYNGPLYVIARTGSDATEVIHTQAWGDPPDGDYYLVVRRVGADWTFERWLTDPALGGTAEHTITYTDIPVSTSSVPAGRPEDVRYNWWAKDGMSTGDVVNLQVDEVRRREQKLVGRLVASLLNSDGTYLDVELGIGT